MTTQKHLKRRVRERMSQTGERYAAARRSVVNHERAGTDADPTQAAGIHPETSALRGALAQIGVIAPHAGRPWTEAMLLGLGGGPGIGVFSFHYAASDFSSFYLGARHLWDDSPAFLAAAARRAGARTAVLETGSTRAASTHLREALAAGRGVIASVDVQPLGYRAIPAEPAGGGYHVVLVRSADDDRGTVTVQDLFPGPIEVPATAFEAARARIRSQKHRLVVVELPAENAVALSLETAAREALIAAADGLEGSLDPSAGGRRGRNFNLDALATWGDRLHGDRTADGWARMFPRGHRLWRGLSSIAQYVNHAGTGGGLLRPLYARFLREAGAALGWPALDDAAARYEALGRDWSALAAAALPADVPELAETGRLLARRESAFLDRGPAATDELHEIWSRLAQIETGMRTAFPLDDAAVDGLLAGLQARVRDLESGERAAARMLRTIAGESTPRSDGRGGVR
ncbi:MAG: DUF4872 domain-containing protein [Chloroflexi bacterium]|nr:DUF4872 domain-containing protein [Chloroflexota bacterium]